MHEVEQITENPQFSLCNIKYLMWSRKLWLPLQMWVLVSPLSWSLSPAPMTMSHHRVLHSFIFINATRHVADYQLKHYLGLKSFIDNIGFFLKVSHWFLRYKNREYRHCKPNILEGRRLGIVDTNHDFFETPRRCILTWYPQN